MLKYSKTYFERNSLNVTNYRTLYGLSMALITSKYYD